MHESGSFINTHHKLLGTYDILKNTEFYGLTAEESLLIATTASTDEMHMIDITEPFENLSHKK